MYFYFIVIITQKIGEKHYYGKMCKCCTRVRYARELNHFTREELAEYAGISTKFLYEIENNHKGMSAHTL